MDVVRYAFHDMPFQEVVAISRDHLSRIALFDVEPLEGDRLHSIGMDVRVMPELNVGRLWCSPGRATRTAAHIADGNDNVVLVMPVNADMVISSKGREDTLCRAGEAYVWASDEPASFFYGQECDTLNLSLPRAALAALAVDPDARAMTRLDPGCAADLWLLRSYAKLLTRDGTLTPEAAHLAALHVRDLAGLLLSRDAEHLDAAGRRGVRTARLQAIKADIAANAARPLSAEAVALRHGVSPRYLRALFADEGTSFTDFLLSRRLELARRMLCNPGLARHTVAAIAYEAGFNDLSYFNRAFRRRYGMTPSDARANGQRP